MTAASPSPATWPDRWHDCAVSAGPLSPAGGWQARRGARARGALSGLSDDESRQPGGHRHYVCTYPAKKALRAICQKVKAICRSTSINQPLSVLLHRLNPVLRGWCAYFRPGVSSATFNYLAAITWRQVMSWLRRKHRRATWKYLRRRYCGGGWQPADGNTGLLHTGTISTTRYRYRGAAIPSPWQAQG